MQFLFGFVLSGGPRTQYLKCLVPEANRGMAFGTRVVCYWVLASVQICFVRFL